MGRFIRKLDRGGTFGGGQGSLKKKRNRNLDSYMDRKEKGKKREKGEKGDKGLRQQGPWEWKREGSIRGLGGGTRIREDCIGTDLSK